MAATIFNGNFVKTLKDNLKVGSAIDIQTGTVDPSSSATSANIGSLYFNTSTGNVYRKTDSGSSTNWSLLNAAQNPAYFAAKDADYTLTTSDDYAPFAPTANRVVTIPTAVGSAGKIYRIKKINTTAFTLTVNTTSSQTIGLRASGSIVFRKLGDGMTIISNGTNWDILEKQEYEVLTSLPGATGLSGTSAGNYLSVGASVTLTYGLWELVGTFGLNIGSGTSIGLINNSGFYGAAGTGTSTPPTALGGTISGDVSYANMNSTYLILAVSAGASSRYVSGPIKILIMVTSSTTAYLVPQVDYATSGTSSVTPSIFARRIF